MKTSSEESLFPDWAVDMTEMPAQRPSRYKLAKRKVNNLNLMSYPDFDVEGEEQMPVVKAYNGGIPDNWVSYSHRRTILRTSECGLHGFEYDYRIDRTWTHPEEDVDILKRFQCVIAPDYSVFVGHVVEGKEHAQKELFKLGIEELIQRKKPTELIVYGASLEFDPGIEVLYVKGQIQKMRSL